MRTRVITNRRRVFTTKLLIETALKSPRLATFELKQCPQEGVNWPTLKGEKNQRKSEEKNTVFFLSGTTTIHLHELQGGF